jgi:choline dehydrogenase
MMSKILAASICVLYAAAQNSTTKQYDYVIAGAGTAGLLLANILSEDPNVSVLVLEAGTDSRTEVNVTDPERRGTICTLSRCSQCRNKLIIYTVGTIQHTQYDWGFESTLQPGLYDNGTGGSQYVPRGKTMGGTSAMNWM